MTKVWRIADKNDAGYIVATESLPKNQEMYDYIDAFDQTMGHKLPPDNKIPKNAKFAFKTNPGQIGMEFTQGMKKYGVDLKVKSMNLHSKQIVWQDEHQVAYLPKKTFPKESNPNALRKK